MEDLCESILSSPSFPPPENRLFLITTIPEEGLIEKISFGARISAPQIIQLIGCNDLFVYMRCGRFLTLSDLSKMFSINVDEHVKTI